VLLAGGHHHLPEKAMNQPSAAQHARQLLKQGELTRATDWLKQHQANEACMSVLRELYLGEQQTAEALPLIQQMAEADSAEGLVAQSILAFLDADLTRAIDLAEQALQLNAELATAHNHLGRALQNSGQSGKAIKAFKAAVRLDPEYAQAWHNLGHTRRALGVMDEAIEHYQKAIGAQPQYQSAWFNLAITLSVLEQHSQAVEAFDQLLSINDQHVLAWVNKGLACHVLGDLEQAISCYDRAMDLDPKLAMTYSYKGILLNEMQQSEQAIRCLQHAISLDANEIDAWCELCDVYEKTNDLEQAEQANSKALALDPNHPTALIDAARIHKRNKDFEAALGFLQRVNVAALPTRKATEYWFERAELLDKAGQYEAAYQAYVQANELARQSPRFTAVDQQAFKQRLVEIDAATEHFKPLKKASFWQRLSGKGQAADDPELGSRLCFLVGFPRSGTTLLDTILSVHQDIHSIEEMPTIERVIQGVKAAGQNHLDPDFSAVADWPALREQYWAQVAQHASPESGQWILDKLPLRFLEAEFIRQLFPQARFIFMHRHPADVILSNFMQNFVPNEAFVNFTSLADAVSTYEQCMHLWLKLRPRLGQSLLEISYEDLVQQPRPTVNQVCRLLSIDFTEQMLETDRRLASRDRVSTNSYAQVAEDINTRSVSRWQNYAGPFEPHMERLEPLIKALTS
jgi:tetratricopeptide (TPR) repeat protein